MRRISRRRGRLPSLASHAVIPGRENDAMAVEDNQAIRLAKDSGIRLSARLVVLGTGVLQVKQIKVVVDGVAPFLVEAKEGYFLRVDSESNYFRVTAFRTAKAFGISWVVSKQVIAGFTLLKLVLWTEVM